MSSSSGDFEQYSATLLTAVERQLGELSAQQIRLSQERKSDADIRAIADAAALDFWKSKAKIGVAFLAGLLCLFSLGFLKPQIAAQPVLEHLYPAASRFSTFTPHFQKLGLAQLPEVKQGIEPEIWETMTTAEKDEFAQLLDRGAFYAALLERFRADLVREFGTYTNPRTVDASSVVSFGKVPVPATAVVLAKKHDGEGTTCGKLFDHEAKQAVVVIPNEARETDYGWLGCGSYYPFETVLKVHDARSIGGILLMGVQRGNVDGLQIRLSRAAAIELGLPGSESYQGMATVHVSVEGTR